MGKLEKVAERMSEKAKALAAALSGIRKQYGEGSIMAMGEGSQQAIEVIPTGSIGLDLALGCGGLPRGRVVEIYGAESSGKTTLCLSAIAQCQAKKGIAAFIDAEHALDPSYARRLGVNLENLLVSQPDSGEQALEIADALVRSGSVDLIVVDSVAALVPRAEIEGEMGDSHVGLHARLMSQALRKLTAAVAKSKTTVVFVNQIRMKIGVMFGNPETTTGGHALKFYSSVRLEVRRAGQVKDGDKVVASKARVKVVKNKVAPPFGEAELEIRYSFGINRSAEVLDLASRDGVNLVDRNGAWYVYNGERLGQGRDRAAETLDRQPELREKIAAELVARLSGDAAGGLEAPLAAIA
ncbi:recombinase RecA [Vulgatibacter incomptus]|uniref:Protein RecA n=1 Tax=Vulgatibacter incomptus TaxID=1391653 RepID=A0A0K1PFB4_9BACT|nr:recombinase RecA [Vulgatibacter incomptus]AKU91804.1 RecA protein [Vulgatibacter incomptus]